MHTSSPLVINWHLTEACNYRCQYCYAAWNRPDREKPLARDASRSQALLKQLWTSFTQTNPQIDGASYATGSKLRLNIAGGEPLLYEQDVHRIIQEAQQIGFDVSIITNGSLLTPACAKSLAPSLAWLGISIDSASTKKNIAIGRLDNRQRQTNLQDLASTITLARRTNPSLRIKINTVVNAINWEDDLSHVLNAIRPERWKVLRALPVVGEQLTISDDQFQHFVSKHRTFSDIACIEDNSDMMDSYIMIDPHGRFFQNSNTGNGTGYIYSRPILDVGVESAFSEINFNVTRFRQRYLNTSTTIAS